MSVWLRENPRCAGRTGLVAGFGMLSTCAQAFALELQAFSVLPFQQTTDLVEKLRAQKVLFEELIIPDEFFDLLRWSDWVISKQ